MPTIIECGPNCRERCPAWGKEPCLGCGVKFTRVGMSIHLQLEECPGRCENCGGIAQGNTCCPPPAGWNDLGNGDGGQVRSPR